MMTSPKTMLQQARRGGYAIGAFNINNMEVLQGVVEAAVQERAPIIVQT
ncbi:MAG: class II fructose-bisphosphate aldolase, partial [Patescibacteria group bacterium]